MSRATELATQLRKIAHELRTYNPAADEYKGQHIHGVWAREIDAAIALHDADRERQAGEAVAQDAFTKALSIRTAQGWSLTGKAVPVLYTDAINGEQVCRDDLWICTTSALATQPTASPEQAEAPSLPFVGEPCRVCADGTYRLDSNGYSQFARCDRCRSVPTLLDYPTSATQPTASNAGEREALQVAAQYTALMDRRDAATIEAALATKPPAGEQKPVTVIARNPAGQISMRQPNGEPFDMSSYVGSALYFEPQPEQVAQDGERVRLLTEVETTGEGLRYSLDCLVNNGVNTFRVCDEEENEYLGDDWVLDPVQAIDEAIRAARARGEGGRNADQA